MPVLRFLHDVSRAVNSLYRITVTAIVGYQVVKQVWNTEKQEKEERDRQKQRKQQEQEEGDDDQDQ